MARRRSAAAALAIASSANAAASVTAESVAAVAEYLRGMVRQKQPCWPSRRVRI